MYDTVVTEDGRLAIVLRLPYNKVPPKEVHEIHEPIVIEYNEPDAEEPEGSRVIIIDLEEDEET